MSPDLELLLRVFIDKRRADNAVFLDSRGQRYRPGNDRSGSLDRFYNLLGRLIYQFMVETFYLDIVGQTRALVRLMRLPEAPHQSATKVLFD